VWAALCISLVLTACAADPNIRKQEHFERGNRHAGQGRLQEAVIEYRNAVQIDPMFADARAKLAASHERLGETREALGEYIRAADLRPNDVELQLKAASLQVAAGMSGDALGRVDVALAREPGNVEAHLLRANALAGLRDFDQALAAIEAGLRLDPLRGATHAQLGTLHAARGDTARAEASLNRAVELAPELIDSHLALANFYWEASRPSEAEHALRSALAAAPGHEGANSAMAVLLMATGRAADAEIHLRRAVEVATSDRALLALADYYVDRGRPGDAIALLKPLADNSRTAPEAVPGLALAHAAAGDWPAAYALVDEMLTQDPRDAEALQLKGQLLLQQGRRDDALTSLRSATAADPRHAAAQFSLGQLLAARGDLPGAEAAFREVLRSNPSESAAQVELSLLQLASGRPEEALRTAQEAARSAPANLDVRLMFVRSLLAAGQSDKARDEIQLLLTSYRGVAAVHVQNGVLLAARNEWSAARAAFERALEIQPASLEALAGLVEVDLRLKNFMSAIRRVEQRLAQGEVTPAVLLLAARTYRSGGDMDGAEKALRRAIELDSAALTAYSILADLYLSQGKLAPALQEFDALATRQSTPASALTMAGLILQAQGKDELARQRFERAVAIDANAAVAANNLAWMYAEKRERLDDALRLARVAADALPDAPEVLDTLGWVHYQSDLPALAVPPLTRCIEKDPRNATCQYHLGLALVKTGAAARGRESLMRALALRGDAPWSEDARRALTALEGQASR